MSPAKRTENGKKKKKKKSPGQRGAAADREVSVPNANEPAYAASLAGKPLADDASADTVNAVRADDGDSFDDLEQRIRQKAYHNFCMRNECDGSELEDWLAAEREVRANDAPMSLDRPADDGRPEVTR